jgi:hypothetical protein
VAKAILTIEDTDSGTVTVSVDFVPELHTDEEMTSAQQLAVDLLQDVKDGESFLDRLSKG